MHLYRGSWPVFANLIAFTILKKWIERDRDNFFSPRYTSYTTCQILLQHTVFIQKEDAHS